MRILTPPTAPLLLPGPIARTRKPNPLLLAAAVLAILAGILIVSTHWRSVKPPPSTPLLATLMTGKRYYLVQFKRVSVTVNGRKLPGYAISYRERQSNGWALGSFVELRSGIRLNSKLKVNGLAITELNAEHKPVRMEWNPAHIKPDSNPHPDMVL